MAEKCSRRAEEYVSNDHARESVNLPDDPATMVQKLDIKWFYRRDGSRITTGNGQRQPTQRKGG
jgi:hypothetical protein